MSQEKQGALPPFVQFLISELIKILPDLLNLLQTKEDIKAFLEHVKAFKK